MVLGVALVLCQADPVLNDGQSGNDDDDGSRQSVLESVCQKIIEKVMRDHEDEKLCACAFLFLSNVLLSNEWLCDVLTFRSFGS